MLRRRWSDGLVIEHILSRRKGERLNAYSYATAYPDVYAAAQRIFGSWGAAIEAAGLDYEAVRLYRQWSKAKVLEEVKALKKGRKPLNSLFIQRKMRPLYLAALKRFGSWGKALKAAGLDYSKVKLRRTLSKPFVKSALLKLRAKGESLAYTNMRKRHLWLLAAAMKLFGDGSWEKARKACGVKDNFRKLRYLKTKKAKAR